MLTHPTTDRLRELGLAGMARALEEQRRQPDNIDLGFEDRLAVNGGPIVHKSGGVIFPNLLRSPAPEPPRGSGAGERCRPGFEPVM